MTITARQARLLAALLSGETMPNAARLCNVPERTARRWLTLPEFRQTLKDGQSGMVTAATRKAAGLLTRALDTLADVLDSPATTPSAKVGAARVLLEHTARLLELSDFAERLEALERRLDDAGNSGAA